MDRDDKDIIRELEFLRDGLRDFPLEPDVLEFAGVFGIQLEVGFDECFEEIVFLFFRKRPPLGLDVLPRRAAADGSGQIRRI
jgi:hypothetical protein